MIIARKAVSGVGWAYGAFFTDKVLTLATTAILARMLTPDDFGVIAAALLFVALVDAFRDFGVRDALIYTDDGASAADTAFWLILGFGASQFLAALALAPLAIHVVSDERIVAVTQVLATVFLINGLGLTHEALLQKQLRFRGRYTADLVATAIKAAVATVLVVGGAGIWSIIAAHLAAAAVRTLARWMILDWRPRLRFEIEEARTLVRFGTHVFLVGLMGALAARTDHILIAAFLDQRQLAFFFIASRIPEMLLYQLNSVLTNVLFSLFAAIKEQRELLMRAFFRTLKYSALATVPVGCGFVAVAPELVPVMFGGQWHESVALAQILAGAAVAMCLHWSSGDVFKALGRPDIVTKLTLIEIMYTTPIVAGLLAHYRDPLAACLGMLLCSVIAGAVRLWLVARVLNYDWRIYGALFGTAFAGGGAILAGVAAWRHAVAYWSPELLLLTSVPLGVALYAIVVWILEKDEVASAARLLADVWGGAQEAHSSPRTSESV